MPSTEASSTERRRLVELVQELLPSGEPIGGDAHRRSEESQVVSFHPRGAVGLAERCPARACCTACAASPGERSTNGGTTGSTGPCTLEITEPKWGLPSRLADPHGEAGHALEARMLVELADERADHRQLVHDGRRSGQQLADLDSRQLRGDRLELAADSRGSIGLEVERVLVRQAAREVDHDHRLVRRPSRRSGSRRRSRQRLGLEQPGKAQFLPSPARRS